MCIATLSLGIESYFSNEINGKTGESVVAVEFKFLYYISLLVIVIILLAKVKCVKFKNRGTGYQAIATLLILCYASILQWECIR